MVQFDVKAAAEDDDGTNLLESLGFWQATAVLAVIAALALGATLALLRRRMSKLIGDYEQFNDVAVPLQLRREGKDIHLGEAIRYVITDGDSRDERTRLMAEALADDDVQYDSEAYVDRLVRATETMLISFGYSCEKLLENIAI